MAENIFFTSLTIPEVKELFRQELQSYFSENPQTAIQQSQITDKPLTIKDAAAFLSLAVATIYTLVSRNEIPHHKKGKRLYFNQIELLNWVKEGRRKTNNELKIEAETYLTGKKCKLK